MTGLAFAYAMYTIARLKKENRATELEDRRLTTIISSMGEGVLVVDVKSHVILMNQAAGAALRIAPAEAIGKSIGDIFTLSIKGMSLDFRADLSRFMQSIDIIRVGIRDDYTIKSRDGKSFPIAMIVTPYFENTVILGAIILFHDITQEKEINRSKDEFVSLASHQLRTPLSSINWYTEMLIAGDAGPLNDEQRKFLEEIYDGNQRMVALVNELLNVSRLELGSFEIDPEPTDIIALARSVMDEQKPQIDARSLSLTTSFEKNAAIMNADPQILRMVMQNLLSNAVKYTPERGKISFNILRDKDGGTKIDVIDTGYGIPKKQHDKIFNKLFRADNIKQKHTEGTGLGLYIVKSVVEHGGGKVWFESEENKGAAFHVMFPANGMRGKEGAKSIH
jgi:two-component system sensor histidine kinase VicK